MSSTAGRILRFQVRDILRNRWLIGYAAVLLAITEALLRLGGGGERAMVSMLNVVLLVVPVVSVVFGTLYLYGAREFIELLLAQPVGRSAMFAGLYAGLSLPLVVAFSVGVAVPFLAHSPADSVPGVAFGMLVGTGILLTLTFTALAFLLALRFEDRARGLGAALLLCLGFSILYDGIVLLLIIVFGDYPLESPLLILTLLNPMDLGRVLLLTTFDAGALMGYTGAVFQRFFGTALGAAVVCLALVTWTAIPLGFGLRRFNRRDF